MGLTKRIALILAGGTGSRMGTDVPKQYIPIQGRMLVTHTLERFYQHDEIDAVQIVAAMEWRAKIRQEQAEYFFSRIPKCAEKFCGFSNPGETRQLSILNGLRDIAAYASDEDIIVVHDTARPLVSAALISAGIEAMAKHDGIMPVLPMKDTVYESVDGYHISKLLRREHIVAGQAPEFFRFKKYLVANEALDADAMRSINGATEPAILSDMNIGIIPGEERNFKITTPEDLERYMEILQKGQAD